MKSKREQKHASIIYRNGNPIAFGFNNGYQHAEEDATEFLEVYGKTKSTTMLNVRLTAGGRIGLSKPCSSCMEMLKEKKFRKVIYSTNEGTFEEIYL